MSRLYFAAKAPVPGQVKTRLGATIGMDPAAELYAAFLTDLSARFATAPFEVAWHVEPGAWPSLSKLAGRADAVREQRGDSWAERQANLFFDTAAAGEGTVVLAATDSPQLRPARVAEAFAELDRHDVVFGPTLDGGYYLVGMKGFHDVLSGVAMSTGSALEQALAHARARRLRAALLAPELDVDTAADLDGLRAAVTGRANLPATAAALALLTQAVPA